MSSQLISRSPDLKRLRDEGYDIEVRAGHLLVKQVPYVTEKREIAYGTLVSPLDLAGDTTQPPSDHVVSFAGSFPCDRDGRALHQIQNASGRWDLAEGLEVQHRFSSKPVGGGSYPDYYQKMTAYVNILAGPARSLDPTVTATPFPVVEDADEESVFQYFDTASSRAGIANITQKLEGWKLAIVGLGGSGSYVLDLVTKTPAREIHLFDRDLFLQHNAFRSPGAAAIEDLRQRYRKVEYFHQVYSRLHRHIVPHPYHIDGTTVDELQDMDFVFLCSEGGDTKRLVVQKLEAFGVPFVDVGMGLYQTDGALAGLVRTTTSADGHREQVWSGQRIPFGEGGVDNEYAQNIQIAELNALNAALAVIRWKKLLGYYLDLEGEYYSVYQIDGNHLLNEP